MTRPAKIDITCVDCNRVFWEPTDNLIKNTVLYRDPEATVEREATCPNCQTVNIVDIPKAWLPQDE